MHDRFFGDLIRISHHRPQCGYRFWVSGLPSLAKDHPHRGVRWAVVVLGWYGL